VKINFYTQHSFIELKKHELHQKEEHVTFYTPLLSALLETQQFKIKLYT
jgi:hypothetical protein